MKKEKNETAIQNLEKARKCLERCSQFISNYGGAYDDVQESLVRIEIAAKKIELCQEHLDQIHNLIKGVIAGEIDSSFSLARIRDLSKI